MPGFETNNGFLAIVFAVGPPSAILTLVSYWIIRRYGESGSTGLSVACLGVSVVVLGPIVVHAAMSVSTGLDALGYLCFGLLIAYPPVGMTASDATDFFSDFLVGALFDSSMVTPLPSDFGKARVKAIQGDVAGAIKEYRNYFNEDPKNPRALFAAARSLEQRGEFESAAGFYREIIHRFQKHKIIWAEACLRLAEVLEHHLRDPKAAEGVLRETMLRARHFEQGRVACQRLMDKGGSSGAPPP